MRLPPPNPLHRNAKKITKEPNIRVGLPCMFGHDQPYTIQSGTVVVGEPTLPNRRTSSTEFNKTAVIMGLLLKKYGSLLDNSRFCPFTGGGDIHLQRKNASSAAVIPSQNLKSPPPFLSPLTMSPLLRLPMSPLLRLLVPPLLRLPLPPAYVCSGKIVPRRQRSSSDKH